MTQDPGDQETNKSDASGSRGDSQSQRRVAKTMDANSPELKKIRELLQIESPEIKKGRRVTKTLLDAPLPESENSQLEDNVSKTLLEAPIPQTKEAKRTRSVAKTMLEANLPVNEQLEPDSQAHAEPARQFVAKTMLDHSVLLDTLNKYAERKSERAAEEAKERADQPAVEFHPVDSKKLAQACAWRWDDEHSKDRFRYCANCQTQVYNFAGLELPEAEALVFKRENKRNPTLYKRADGKFMTRDCPVQVSRKKRIVLFSIAGASVFLVFVTLAIVVLSHPTKNLNSTVEVIEPQPETDIAAREETTDAKTAQSAEFSVQKNADGTRKRPTFGPEDKQSYWE